MLSDEEKEEALSETEIRFRADLLILNSEFPTHRKTEAMEELLEIYNKQSKEIEEYKKQLDLDYVDKHFVPVERYNQLEKEIEEMKKQIDLDNECEIALNNKIMDLEKEIEELKEKNEYLPNWVSKKYVSKDKIKAKIEEYKKQQKEEPDAYLCIKALSSLLEKE